MAMTEIGEMKIIQDVIVKMEPGEKFDIENGFHSGNSTISIDSLEVLTAATAISDDIVSEYNGYVNGILLPGTLVNRDAFTDHTAILTNEDKSLYKVYFKKGAYITNTSEGYPAIVVPESELISIGELTSAKIAKNKTFMGIAGSYTADATATEDDIKEGYVGYANGVRLVGKLKCMPIYSLSAVPVSNDSIAINWNNPNVGPYQGVRIYVSTTENPDLTTPTYEGHGSNDQASGRSSVIFNGLTPNTTYYFYVQPYCGDLNMPDIQVVSTRILA